jgi:hypothetical protein
MRGVYINAKQFLRREARERRRDVLRKPGADNERFTIDIAIVVVQI